MNHVKQRLQKQRMNPKSREYQLAQMHTPKKINSGVGWFVVDVLLSIEPEVGIQV